MKSNISYTIKEKNMEYTTIGEVINEILFDIENGYELELGSSFDKIIKQLQKGETVTVWKQTMACSFPKRYRLKESD
jgi:uncharacterized protein YheU (UPF0270 family)